MSRSLICAEVRSYSDFLLITSLRSSRESLIWCFGLSLLFDLASWMRNLQGRVECRQILTREQDGNGKHSLDEGLDFGAREGNVVAGTAAQLLHDAVDTASGGGEERAELARALSGPVVLGKNDPCRERRRVF